MELTKQNKEGALRAWRVDSRGETELPQLKLVPLRDPGPLVSCLMVSRGRLFPARWAIECFQRQTYANRELLVVLDDPDCPLIAYLDGLGDPRIRWLLSAGQRPLGALRNLAVEQARGEYVCQWDDDDLYSPDRIAVQMAVLKSTGFVACVLRRWTLWWPEAAKLALSGVRCWEGSILALKQALPPYPALRRGEDTLMLEKLIAHHGLLSLDAPELYLYIHHGNNTFGLAHYKEIYSFSTYRWVSQHYWQQLERLNDSMPVRQYLADVGAEAPQGPKAVSGDFPLVSIVVRSMGRPELWYALTSLAAQDYPHLEVVVVDATGGKHPPPPEIVWRDGHVLKWISTGERLLRPQACNVGLDALSGEWFGFLDDDDTLEPDHLSTLMAKSTPTSLVVYGVSRLMDPLGIPRKPLGAYFHRGLMFYTPLFAFPAALINRKVIRFGCRFDPVMEICEDRDFFFQVAAHGDFTFVDLATANIRPDLGTSGTGQGANLDVARLRRYDELLKARWYGEGMYHMYRSSHFVRRGIHAYQTGHQSDARSWFLQGLRAYPDDTNALNGLGFLLTEQGSYDEAEGYFRTAIRIHPSAGEYRLNYARMLERVGRLEEAKEEARRAASDPTVRPAASNLLQRLGATLPSHAMPVAPNQPQVSRLEPCPCGSGRRYKHCCGQASRPDQPPDTHERIAREAMLLEAGGKITAAFDLLQKVPASALKQADLALSCGRICLELGAYETAYEYFHRAAALGEKVKAEQATSETCMQWYKDTRREAMRQTLLRLIEGFRKRASGLSQDAQQEVHIISTLGKLGGQERHALGLFHWLARHVPTQLWSMTPPLAAYASEATIRVIEPSAGHYPTCGHLIFVGTYFEYGPWLRSCWPSRVTISVNIDQLDTLIARLVELEDVPTGFQFDFTFPSSYFKGLTGLPGAIDVPPIDTHRFQPKPSGRSLGRPFVIGRHSREDKLKFHPNDPAFFLDLAAAGYCLRVMGGIGLGARLGTAVAPGKIDLLPEATEDAARFLESLDCFVYRIHPHLVETGGMVILEAMAMGMPVVLFGDRVGLAEVIDHGRNGFLVSTEAEARACIDALAANPGLCSAVGQAARQTVLELMAAREVNLREFYSLN